MRAVTSLPRDRPAAVFLRLIKLLDGYSKNPVADLED